MKKTLIATAVAASVMAPISAHAINFSADGTGQVLLYPYYNTNQGNATFIGVANTTGEVKVLKLRIREGVESEDVLDFQVWLSPYDHWTAVLAQVGGEVRISTADTSCTVPSLANGAPLSDNRISASYTGNILDRLSEGHIEIFEMAVVDAWTNQSDPPIATDDLDLAQSVTHTNAGVPLDCEAAVAFNGNQEGIFVPGAYASQTNVPGVLVGGEFDTPTGGIYGIAAVYNPTDGTYFTYSAEALQNFAATPIFLAQRSAPVTEIPTIVQDDLTSDDLVIREHNIKLFDLPDLSTPDAIELNASTGSIVSLIYGGTNSGPCQVNPGDCMKVATYNLPNSGVDANGNPAGPSFTERPADVKRNAVTAALQAASVTNDFLTGAEFDSDWVFTFPGKYMFREVPVDANGNFLRGGDYEFDDGGPFTVPVDRTTGQACELVAINGPVGIRDREEGKTSQDDVDFSPGISETFELCYEVNVVSINDDGAGDYSAALASSAVWQRASNWPTFGFAQLEFEQTMTDDGDVIHRGMPFIGFAAITDRATDVTRGGTFMHKVVRGLNDN
jgi:hypothetical protein